MGKCSFFLSFFRLCTCVCICVPSQQTTYARWIDREKRSVKLMYRFEAKNSLVFRFPSTQTTWFDPKLGFHRTNPNQAFESIEMSVHHHCHTATHHFLGPTHSTHPARGWCECGAYYTSWKKIYKFSSHQLLLMYKRGSKAREWMGAREKRLYDRNDVVIDNVKRNGISPLCRVGFEENERIRINGITTTRTPPHQ